MVRWTQRLVRRLVSAIALTVVMGGCSATGDGSPSQHSPDGTGSSHTEALPSRHVHAVARNPADGHVHLATHDGLFRLAPGAEPVRIGAVIDLMGFTVAGPNHFYASGHPGPGTDLPNPVGLIESTDGGQTWRPLSRQGQSDFHALTTSRSGVIGFDGEQLAATTEGRAWQPLTPPVTPHAVAASPDGRTVLISSESGLARSTDQGRTWNIIATPLPLQLLAWADATHAVAVAPDGRVATSSDAGATWRPVGTIGGAPHAVSAQRTPAGTEMLVVTGAGLLRSTDDGVTFVPYPL